MYDPINSNHDLDYYTLILLSIPLALYLNMRIRTYTRRQLNYSISTGACTINLWKRKQTKDYYTVNE